MKNELEKCEKMIDVYQKNIKENEETVSIVLEKYNYYRSSERIIQRFKGHIWKT